MAVAGAVPRDVERILGREGQPDQRTLAAPIKRQMGTEGTERIVHRIISAGAVPQVDA